MTPVGTDMLSTRRDTRSTGNFKVAVRVRPLSAREQERGALNDVQDGLCVRADGQAAISISKVESHR